MLRFVNKIMHNKVSVAISVVNEAASWLKDQDGYKILIKQTKNLGDTLHITPIAKHYKLKYPGCKIAFIVGNKFINAHEHNKDFDKLFPIDSNLEGYERISVGQYMIDHIKDIDLVLCPSIFPFGEVWPTHTWSHPVISHQYFLNAKIDLNNMLGDKKLNVPITRDDIIFANKIINEKFKYIAIEYNSYSHPLPWSLDQFNKFISMANGIGFKCISIAGNNEGLLRNTIDGRGISWRRTVSVIKNCKYFVGIGSGNTMLAACTDTKILEINVPDSINMKSCGYANSIIFNGCQPENLIEFIRGEL